MPDGQVGVINLSGTPGIPDKNIMTDTTFNPGQRGILNFEGIPVNSNWPRHRRSLLSYLLHPLPQHTQAPPIEPENGEPLPKKPSRIPNPLVSLRMLFFPDTILITLIYSVYYTTFSCIQASLSPLFIQIYGFTEFQAGLIYIPFGLGAAFGSWFAGKVMNRDYRIVAAQHGITVDEVRGDDLTKFPIEKARFRSVWWTIGISGASVGGYGWAVDRRTSPAIPLILQFLAGTTIAMTFNLNGTLLTDIHPKAPASAQAANNIVRCAMAAGGLALLQLILDHVGPGWCFTLFGATMLGCLGLAWVEWRFGMGWRQKLKKER